MAPVNFTGNEKSTIANELGEDLGILLLEKIDACVDGVTMSSAGAISADGNITSAEVLVSGVTGAGCAGETRLYAPAATKGMVLVRAANSAGDTTTIITNASQAAARTYTIPDAGASAAFVMSSGNTAVTATDNGLTTGIIPTNATFITVTSANANYIVTTPTATVGRIVRGMVNANGFEFRCAGASEKINDVTCGATNEAAVPSDTSFVLECISATEWILTATTKLGAVVTAIVPDARA
jgi:hypothetical protein